MGDIESQGNPLHVPSSSSSSSSSSSANSSHPNTTRPPISSHGGNYYPYAHYQLVIVGHSLGAAAAAILALMLRPQYPRVHCYAYGIPGCVLDQRSATESCEYITAGALCLGLQYPSPSQHPSYPLNTHLTHSTPITPSIPVTPPQYPLSLVCNNHSNNNNTTVIIDCDWVPRMSLHSVTRLREEILDAISRARVHKLVILQAMFKVGQCLVVLL